MKFNLLSFHRAIPLIGAILILLMSSVTWAEISTSALQIQAWQKTGDEIEQLLIRDNPSTNEITRQLDTLTQQLPLQREMIDKLTQALEPLNEELKQLADPTDDEQTENSAETLEALAETRQTVQSKRDEIDSQLRLAKRELLRTERLHEALVRSQRTAITTPLKRREVLWDWSALKSQFNDRQAVWLNKLQALDSNTFKQLFSMAAIFIISFLAGVMVNAQAQKRLLHKNTQALHRAWLMTFIRLMIRLVIASAVLLLWLASLNNTTALAGHITPKLTQTLLWSAFAIALCKTYLAPKGRLLRPTNITPERAAKIFRRILVLTAIHFFTELLQVNQLPSQTVGAVLLNALLNLIAAVAIFDTGRLLINRSHSDQREIKHFAAYCLIGFGIAIGISIATGYLNLASYLRSGLSASVLILLTAMLIWKMADELGHHWFDPIAERSPWWWSSALTLLLGGLSIIALLFCWGLPGSDIERLGSSLISGGEIAGINIQPRALLVALSLLILGGTAIGWFKRYLLNDFLPRTGLELGARTALVTGAGYAAFTALFLVAISAAGLDLSNLAIVAGALSVGIGFGLQTIFNNFISGLILLVERPIKPGDWVVVGGRHGTVTNVKVRATEIETFDRSTLVVPNAELISQTLENWTHESNIGRVVVPIGVAYGSDVEQVREILLDVAQSAPGVMVDPEPSAYFLNFGNDALEFELRAYLADVNNVLLIKNHICTSIYQRFNEAGIEIPFPQRTVHIAASSTPQAEAKED